MATLDDTGDHHEVVDVTPRGGRPRVLMVVANPGVSTTTASCAGSSGAAATRRPAR